jgi:hypothetical protein
MRFTQVRQRVGASFLLVLLFGTSATALGNSAKPQSPRTYLNVPNPQLKQSSLPTGPVHMLEIHIDPQAKHPRLLLPREWMEAPGPGSPRLPGVGDVQRRTRTLIAGTAMSLAVSLGGITLLRRGRGTFLVATALIGSTAVVCAGFAWANSPVPDRESPYPKPKSSLGSASGGLAYRRPVQVEFSTDTNMAILVFDGDLNTLGLDGNLGILSFRLDRLLLSKLGQSLSLDGAPSAPSRSLIAKGTTVDSALQGALPAKFQPKESNPLRDYGVLLSASMSDATTLRDYRPTFARSLEDFLFDGNVSVFAPAGPGTSTYGRRGVQVRP